jgi:hypothetical protein
MFIRRIIILCIIVHEECITFHSVFAILSAKIIHLANYFFVIEAIPIVPILFGNSLILFSIARFRRLRTRMNILVANLLVSDFLVGLIMIPYDISFVMVIAKNHDAKIRSANHFLLLLCTCASGNIMAKYRSTEIRSRFSTDDPKNRI